MSESQRLQRLQDYNILDTPPEEEFDAIIRLAARVCNTPVAMINFIDENKELQGSAANADLSSPVN